MRLGEAEEVGAAAAQVAVPEPEGRAEFGVVPRMAAPVVVPDVACRRVGVHEVAILPEAVPGAVVYLALIVGKDRIEAVLEGLLEGRGAVGEAPDAKDTRGVDVLGRSGEEWKLGASCCHSHGVCAGREGCRCEERKLAGAGDAIGGAEAGLGVFIRGVESVTGGIVETHVHLRRVGRPEPCDELRSWAAGLLDLKRGGERLPEVLDADGDPSAEIAY